MLIDRIRSLTRHTAIYGIGDLLGRVVSILLLPVYARLLTAEDNGVRTLAFACIGFCTVFYSLGINQALIRYLSGENDPADRRTRFSSAFWTLLFIGLLLSSALGLASAPLARYLLGSEAHTSIFHLVAIIIFLDTLSEPLFALCRARQQSVAYAAVRLVQHTLQMGLTVTLIVGFGIGVEAIFWSNVASSAFALFALLPLGWKQFRLTWDRATVRDLLSFGVPFVPSALAVMVINLSDRFLIKFYLGLDATGVYDISYKFGLPMLLVVRAFRSAWAPALLSVPDPGEARAVCARVTTYFSMAAVLLFLCIAAFSRELILLVSGHNAPVYLPGQAVVPLIALAYLFYGLYVILTAGIYAEARTRMLPAIVGAGAVLNVGLNLLLIPRLGFVVAAWSTLAAYTLMAVLLYLNVRRFYPVPYEYRRLVKVGVAGSVVFLSMFPYLHDTTPAGIVARGIFLLGYPLILWGWNFFDPREWKHLTAAVGFSGIESKANHHL